jgi:hypothetical protein
VSEQSHAVARSWPRRRLPVTVKTRLVPPLTHREAAELNTCCLANIIANITTTTERAPIQGHAELIGSLGLPAQPLSCPAQRAR